MEGIKQDVPFAVRVRPFRRLSSGLVAVAFSQVIETLGAVSLSLPKLAERGGKSGKKRAIIAVARKLAVLLHRLWVSGEVTPAQHGSASQITGFPIFGP